MSEHSTSDQSSLSETARPRFIFNPPPGGDISVRSCDGQVFCVHTLLLGLASSVFSDMSTIGTQTAEIIDLAEDSESLSVMLVHIYPSGIPPPLDSFELLEKSLKVAQKYDIQAMLQKLDRALSTESSCKELFKADPIRMFHLSATHSLRQSQTVAIREVRPRHCDLSCPEDIAKLAETYPNSSHVIALMGVQAARAEILFRFFYDLGYEDGLDVCNPTPDDENSWLICKDCKTKMITNFTAPVTYYPIWLNSWVHSLYRKFINEPFGTHAHLFTVPMFETLISRPGNTPFCQSCIKAALKAKKGRILEAWLRDVQAELEERLEALDDLLVL
ncbi:hypothetical protein FS749_009823 [Ceratobasidium sp. UAMH 11750]|nr:hypothetical protein FS749_009823 [Ceratobasidium sp. UAMH 11750]